MSHSFTPPQGRDLRTIHAEDVIHADRRKVLDNVVNHPVWPGYGVHAVDGTCLDIAAMVPNTRWAITPYVEPRLLRNP